MGNRVVMAMVGWLCDVKKVGEGFPNRPCRDKPNIDTMNRKRNNNKHTQYNRNNTMAGPSP